jgi:hypothetical protein
MDTEESLAFKVSSSIFAFSIILDLPVSIILSQNSEVKAF